MSLDKAGSVLSADSQLKTIAPLIRLNQGTAHLATPQLVALPDFHVWHTTLQIPQLVLPNLVAQL